MGVLLPNDLKLLLTQNGFNPNKKTVYEIVAEFDAEEAGGLSFIEFMKAMDTKPYLSESKKEIGAIFKKYDRNNKGYLTLDDLQQINNHVKENVDEETLALMLEKADSNNDGKISFEDFYSVMVKTSYWLTGCMEVNLFIHWIDCMHYCIEEVRFSLNSILILYLLKIMISFLNGLKDC